MDEVVSGFADNSIWTNFCDRHQGHRFLSCDPLYALTWKLIDVIQEKVPGFFSADDEAFERDLARTAMHGFFLGRPIGGDWNRASSSVYPLPNWPFEPVKVSPRTLKNIGKIPARTIDEFIGRIDQLPNGPAWDDLGWLAPPLKLPAVMTRGHKTSIDAVKSTIAAFHKAADDAPHPIDRGRQDRTNQTTSVDPEIHPIQLAQEQEKKEQQFIEERDESYAGWLITNVDYRAELRVIKLKCEASIRKQGAFPWLPTSTKSSPRKDAYRCDKRFYDFYRRWGLSTLLTWELPLPQEPVVASVTAGSEPLDGDGALVLIPWHLLRGGQLNLQQLFKRLTIESAPRHLRPWLQKSSGKQGKESDITLRELFGIYRSFELVLKRRYTDRCSGNIDSLDQVFKTMLGRSEELARKLRQRLARKLKALGSRLRLD